MRLISGYMRTAGQYLATPKGRHDAFDYARGAGIIAISMAAAYALARILAG